MANGESTRTFYILLALLVISLTLGGTMLWRKMGSPPEAPQAPSRQSPTRFVGTAEAPSASFPELAAEPSAVVAGIEPVGRRDTAPDVVVTPDRSTRPVTPPDAGVRGGTSMADLLRQLSAIKAKGPGVDTREELVSLGRALASEDFDNALRLMGAVSDFFTKSNLCRGIFEEKAISDPAVAIAAARDLDPGKMVGAAALQNKRIYYEALMASMKGWVHTDPAAASQYIGELPEDYQLVAAQSVYTAWAKTDPAAAISAMDRLTTEAQSRILPEVITGWAEATPAQAWNFVLGLSDEEMAGKNLVLANIATSWAQKDVATAVAWIDQTLTDDAQYADVLERVTRNLATRNPETAAVLLAAVPGMYERQSELLTSTLRSWIGSDPVAASDWVSSLTDAAMQATAVKLTASLWGTQDLESALKWAAGLSDGLSRAYALSNVAIQQGNRNPETSVDWIFAIDDDFARGRTAAGYIMGRMRRAGDNATTEALKQIISSDTIDFDDVDRLILKSRISDEEKATLLGLIR